MRSRDILEKLDKVNLIQKYLYMAEDHHIDIYNAINTPLRIYMDERCNVWCKNMNFPDTPPMNYSEEMSVGMWLAAVDILSVQPAVEFPNRFKNRLEEISQITMMNLAINNT